MSKAGRKQGSFFSGAARSHALLFQVLGLAIAYFITGKLGTLLAIPPGYATAIWPPSGIALGWALIYGHRVWPGIFLGAFLLNSQIAWAHSPLSEIPAASLVGLAIGIGASLQAVAGAYLIRRFAHFPNPLANEKNVLLFFLFGGPISSLVNSTLSVSILSATARIAPANFLPTWGTWWMGDTLGIFIFTPLVLVWLQQPRNIWLNRRMVITLPIAVMFIISTAVVFYEARHNYNLLKAEFGQRATELDNALEKSISVHFNVLRSLESFYSASNNVNRDDFQTFVAYPLSHFKGVQALEWAPVVLATEREAYEQNLAKEGFPNFRITEKTPGTGIMAAKNRQEYVPVTYIAPYQGNENALGYDLYSDAKRREAINLARDSGDIAVTARIRLIQEVDDQYGVLAAMPLYRKGLSHDTVDKRRQTIMGYVLAVFRGGDIVTAALKGMNLNGLSYRLIDWGNPESGQVIFSSDPNGPTPLFAQENIFLGRPFSLRNRFIIPVGERQWLFEVIPTQTYFAHYRSDSIWLILSVGLMLTGMVGMLALVFSGREGELRKLVEVRTEKQHQALKHLGIQSSRLQTLLETASDGVHILNEKGDVVQFSHAFARMLGYSYQEIDGLNVADWDAQIPKDQLLDKLQALIKQGAAFETKHRRKDGSIIDVEINAKGVELEGKRYLYASSRDITERKVLERELLASAKEIEELYDHAPCGYHSIDKNGIVLRMNATELAWLGYRHEEVVGKMKVSDFYTPAGKRLFEATFPDFVKNGQAKTLEFDLVGKNGASRHVSMSSIAIRDADGNFVMSHSVFYDITELKNTQNQLQQLTREQNAMLDNELVGIAKLKNRCFVWKNKAMERIFGYGPGELDNKPSRILYPDEAAYQAMGEAFQLIADSNGVYRAQRELVRKYGDKIWVDVSGIMLSKEDNESLWMLADISPMKKRQDEIEWLAYHDVLTGLPNRLLISEKLEQMLAEAKQKKQLLAVCYLDLDGFKPINDKFGHAAGDKLLKDIAARMQFSVRADDTIGRLGGDEFILLLASLHSPEEVQTMLQRVMETINEPVMLSGSAQINVGASIGVSLYPLDDSPPDMLIRHADQAMYLAKKSGRNRICLFSPEGMG